MADYHDFAELHGRMGLSPQEAANWDNGIFEAVRVVECDWGDRVTVYNDLMGTAYPYIAGTGAIAVGGTMAGWGESSDGGDPLVAYEKARLTIRYDNRVQLVGGHWVSERLFPSAEFRQLDARSFRWENNDGRLVRDEEGPAMRHVFLDYVLTYHKAISLPAAILTHLGGCNGAQVASYTLGLTFAPEALILVAAVARRTLAPGMIPAWELTEHFQFRPSGANTFWRAETNQYEPMYHARGTGRYIQHPLLDFTQLVPPLAP